MTFTQERSLKSPRLGKIKALGLKAKECFFLLFDVAYVFVVGNSNSNSILNYF